MGTVRSGPVDSETATHTKGGTELIALRFLSGGDAGCWLLAVGCMAIGSEVQTAVVCKMWCLIKGNHTLVVCHLSPIFGRMHYFGRMPCIAHIWPHALSGLTRDAPLRGVLGEVSKMTQVTFRMITGTQ